jgi:cytoskeletal protein RodZ
MPALGERFRAAREARGLSLSDVAEQIRIRSVYLAAIEDENWNAIGAPVYIRGFVRTYARFLGIDPEEVVSEFNAAAAAQAPVPTPAPEAAPPPDRVSAESAQSRNLSYMIWVASAVAVMLIAFIVYQEMLLRQRAPRLAAASPAPVASALPSNAPGAASSLRSPAPPAAPNSLEIRLSAPSWVRVVVDGNVSMEGTFPAGTVKQFHGKVAQLRIGNAGGVAVRVDGKDVGKLGASGDVIDRRFTL